MSFKDIAVEAGGGQFIKLAVGENRLRVVSDAVLYWKNVKDKRQYVTKEGAAKDADQKETKPRFAMWAIDRADGQIKLWETSGGIIRDIKNLANGSDSAFDGLPPYDFIVNRVGTGQTDTRYTLRPAMMATALTAEEQTAVSVLEPINLYLRKESLDKDSVAPF